MTKRERRTYIKEFKNKLIEEVLKTFAIKSSLSMKE